MTMEWFVTSPFSLIATQKSWTDLEMPAQQIPVQYLFAYGVQPAYTKKTTLAF